MSKIHKVEMFIVDICDDFNGLQSYIDYAENDKYAPRLFVTKSESKEFEWDDELIINKLCATTDNYNEFFRKLGENNDT